MGFPVGNQFWKNRSKHGRDKLFADPELLWEAACEYFDWCQANPWVRIDFKGKDSDRVEIPTPRPFTLKGLCLYLDCSEAYFRSFKNQERKDSDDFITVITRIEETIYTHKFEGATVGAFNANIISRDLGLADNIDHTTKGEAIKNLQIEIVHTKDTGEQST